MSMIHEFGATVQAHSIHNPHTKLQYEPGFFC